MKRKFFQKVYIYEIMIKDINDALWKNDFKSGVEYDAFTQLLLFLEDLDFEG